MSEACSVHSQGVVILDTVCFLPLPVDSSFSYKRYCLLCAHSMSRKSGKASAAIQLLSGPELNLLH